MYMPLVYTPVAPGVLEPSKDITLDWVIFKNENLISIMAVSQQSPMNDLIGKNGPSTARSVLEPT